MLENSLSVKTECRLTRYESGTLRELWTIAWPLMLASFSGSFMTFIDRAILARYQSSAFDACSAAQPWFWTFEGIFMSFIMCTEVFVGRFNGARLYRKIGPAVWQMVILSFLTYFILIPIIWNAHYLLADNIEEIGLPYLQLLLSTLPFEMAAFGAIGAFFVGRGETKKIPLVLLTVNFLNGILDVWFVFGGLGIPSLGIVGAALATNIANFCSFFIFLTLFLRKKYRSKYGINTLCWSWSFLKECIHIGMPNAATCGVLMGGWSMGYQFLSLELPLPLYKAYCISFTIYNFVFFVMDGTGKGVGTLCANFVGSNQPFLMGKVLKKACQLTYIFALLFLVFLLFSSPIVHFLAPDEFLKNPLFKRQITLFLTWYWVLFVVETLCFCAQYFLFALLKTKIVLLFNVTASWGLCLLPTYFLISHYHMNPVVFVQLACLEHGLLLICFFVWFRRGNWQKMRVLKN